MQVHESSETPRRPPPSRRIQAARTRTDQREADEWRQAAWTMFWLVVAGKILIMIALAVVAVHSMKTSFGVWSVLILWNWSWILLAALLLGGPALYWFRLRRARRKRAALIYAEWHVD